MGSHGRRQECFQNSNWLPYMYLPVVLPVKILKALLPSPILLTSTVHPNLLNLINLIIDGK